MRTLRMIGSTFGALVLAGTLAAVASPAYAAAAEDCTTVKVEGRESADSGENGNDWATTTLTRTTKVCATAAPDEGDWTYVATVTDSGEFVTRPGESPGIALATLKGGVRGTVNGHFSATFKAPKWTGDLTTPATTTATSEWVAAAFPGAEVFGAAGPVAGWAWNYNLCGEKGEWWVNAEGGNSGDITEKVCPTTEPTTEPTGQPTVEPTGQPTTAPTTGPTVPAPGAGGGLPVTGSPAAVLGGVGLAAVLLGAGTLLLLRRRRVQFES